MRAREDLRHRVQHRLAELDLGTADRGEYDDDDLGQGKSNKVTRLVSGKLRTNDHQIIAQGDWPHFYVYKQTGRPAAYDDLTLAEFCYGYLQLLERCTEPDRSLIYAHFLELMEDATRYRWPTVRAYHAVFLGMLEAGRITWADSQQKIALRRQFVWLHGTTPQG